MCSFPQAGTLAHKDLVKRLKAHGYAPTTFAPILWTHETNGISFTLVVDDLGIKHTSMSSLNHLFDALKKFYSISINAEGNVHVVVSLEWKWNNSVK